MKPGTVSRACARLNARDLLVDPPKARGLRNARPNGSRQPRSVPLAPFDCNAYDARLGRKGWLSFLSLTVLCSELTQGREAGLTPPARCPSWLLNQVTTISDQATLSVRRWRHGPVKFPGQRPPLTASTPTDAVRIQPRTTLDYVEQRGYPSYTLIALASPWRCRPRKQRCEVASDGRR